MTKTRTAPKKRAYKRATPRKGAANQTDIQNNGSSEGTERASLFITISPEGTEDILEVRKDEVSEILYYIANKRGYIVQPVHHDAVMRVQPENQNNPLVQKTRELYEYREQNVKGFARPIDPPAGKPGNDVKKNSMPLFEEFSLRQHSQLHRFERLISRGIQVVCRMNGQSIPESKPAPEPDPNNRIASVNALLDYGNELGDQFEKLIVFLEDSL